MQERPSGQPGRSAGGQSQAWSQQALLGGNRLFPTKTLAQSKAWRSKQTGLAAGSEWGLEKWKVGAGDSLLCGLSRVETGPKTCRRPREAMEGRNTAQAAKATS